MIDIFLIAIRDFETANRPDNVLMSCCIIQNVAHVEGKTVESGPINLNVCVSVCVCVCVSVCVGVCVRQSV